jgi:chemotaxis protein MotA
MISFPIGFIATALIFLFSMGIENLSLYVNFHSALLVGGGTVAILFFSNPLSVLKHLVRDVVQLFYPAPNFDDVKEDLKRLASDKTASLQTKDELIVYAQDLWSQGSNTELFIVLISQKKQELEQKQVDAIQALKNLAKYPPALGMAGTVMGIVTLFQTLEAQKAKMGPALAMAMTATFFGLAIANALVMPLSDRLQVKQINERTYLKNIYQVLLLINSDEAAFLVEEEVGSRAA